MQIFIVHHRMLFNPKYGKVGFVLLPYILFFEFLAPIIEGIGWIMLIYFLLSSQINFDTAWLMIVYVYLFGVAISSVAVIFDISVAKLYNKFREYFKLILISTVEVFLYHPLTVIFSWKGYIDFLFKQKFEWGAMKRQGFEKSDDDIIIDDENMLQNT